VDIKNLLKSSVAVGALVALAAPMQTAHAGSIAQAGKLDLKVGGRIIRGIAYADDGDADHLFHVGGRSADTEIYFSVSGKLTESVTVGGQHRFDVNDPGGAYHLGTTGADTHSTTADGAKYSKVHFAHKSMGTIHMGYWSEAGDGAINLKYGSALVGSPGLISDDIQARTSANADAGFTAGSQVSNLDPGSENMLRYDSPSISGFKVALSTHDEGGWGSALRYSGSMSGINVKAAAHFTNDNGQGTAGGKSYGGSIAAQHASGLHVAGAYAITRTEGSGRKPNYNRISGGYEAKMNSLGKTDFYVQYMDTEDAVTAGRDGTEVNVGITQKLDAIGGAIGLVYSNLEVEDNTATEYQDVDVIYLETQVNF
jgi:hypothetical protein